MREDATVTRPAWSDSPNLHNIEAIGETNGVGRAQVVLTAFAPGPSDGPSGAGGQSPCCLLEPAGIEAI